VLPLGNMPSAGVGRGGAGWGGVGRGGAVRVVPSVGADPLGQELRTRASVASSLLAGLGRVREAFLR
jgi:hypothetical protein